VSSLPDFYVIGLALAVLAILGLFVWQIAEHFRTTATALMRIADRRAAQQRAGIDREKGAGESNIRRTIQMALILALISLVTLMALRKFGFM
jgi:hypothetical protein